MAEFYVRVHAGIFSYVKLYDTIDRTELHDAGFSNDVFSFTERRGVFTIVSVFISVQRKFE